MLPNFQVCLDALVTMVSVVPLVFGQQHPELNTEKYGIATLLPLLDAVKVEGGDSDSSLLDQ